MARLLRPRIIGLTQHVVQRGNNKSDIFRVLQDRERFLDCVADACGRYPVTLDAYVLMTKHVHLMLTPQEPDAISLAMQTIGRRYVSYFNQCHNRTGGLFEGRYRSTVIDSERYWFRCLRYVELNPVRAGLVERADHYRWSSYRCHAWGTDDPLLAQHPLYLALGASPGERQLAWREICRDALPADELVELRRAFRRGTGIKPIDQTSSAASGV